MNPFQIFIFRLILTFINNFFRVQDYMKLNCKLVDPDGGVNVAKKKVRLGLCENISPESCNEFPSDGLQR